MRGTEALPVALSSHAPLDLVIIMLGTNDIYQGVPTPLIRDGLERLVELVRYHPFRLPEPSIPKILLVSPPPMSLCSDPDITSAKVAQSEALAAMIQDRARQLGAGFFDAAQVARASVADGYHLESADSHALGVALRAPVAATLRQSP